MSLNVVLLLMLFIVCPLSLLIYYYTRIVYRQSPARILFYSEQQTKQLSVIVATIASDEKNAFVSAHMSCRLATCDKHSFPNGNSLDVLVVVGTTVDEITPMLNQKFNAGVMRFIWVIKEHDDGDKYLESFAIPVFRTKTLDVNSLKTVLSDEIVPIIHARNVDARKFKLV